MFNKFNSFLNQQTHSVQQPNTIALYRKGLNLYVFFFTLLQLSSAQELWSENSLIPVSFYDGTLLLQSLNLLSHASFAPYYQIFVGALLFCCLLSFVLKKQQLLSVLIYFFTANLIHRTQAIQNGSADLLLLQLFFLIGMNENATDLKEGKLKTLSIALTNYCFLAAQIQLIMVYVISVLYKIQGTQWINGTALHYVLLNPDYTLPVIQKIVHKIPVLLKVCTWIVFLFQAAFPILIWIKKTKLPLFILGIIIHLLIVFVMGITDFGLIMVVMYLLFASEEWSKKQLNKLKLATNQEIK